MIFKYFISFDEEGEVGCFCKERPTDCSEKCDEYIVKLTKIERSNAEKSIDKFINSTSCLNDEANKLTSEIKKVRGKLRRNFR